MHTNQKGSTMTIVITVVLLTAALAIAIFLTMKRNIYQTTKTYMPTNYAQPTSATPASSSSAAAETETDLKKMEQELDKTNLNSVDTEANQLSSDAASL